MQTVFQLPDAPAEAKPVKKPAAKAAPKPKAAKKPAAKAPKTEE